MAAARSSRDPRDRLMVQLLARTGMRVGELVNLDAVVQIGANHWLRIPTLDHSLATFAGHIAYHTDKLPQTYTDSYSYSASATANSYSANPSRDQQQRPDKTPA